MNKFIFSIGVTTFLFLAGCARIYLSEDAHALIRNHRVIAIAPCQVISTGQSYFFPGLYKGQKTASKKYHRIVFDWIHQHIQPEKYWFDILDLDSTFQMLDNYGYYNENTLTPVEICKLLGVDGLIMFKFVLDKPLSETGRDIERFGDYSPTENSNALIEVFDRRENKIVFSYYHRFSPGLERYDEVFVEDLMQVALNKIPYFPPAK